MTDGYTGCQHLLARLAGIQQCRAHAIRRCRGNRGAGDGNRTRMASLEGVWRTAVMAAELAVSMSVGDRD
jgi:hypothetical protein